MTDQWLYDAWGNPIKHIYNEDTDETKLIQYQDCDPILERNKQLQNEGTGYSTSRESRAIGSIPVHLISKWLEEQGVNQALFWQMPRREQVRFYMRYLRDPDWRNLRTSSGPV